MVMINVTAVILRTCAGLICPTGDPTYRIQGQCKFNLDSKVKVVRSNKTLKAGIKKPI